MRGIFNKIKFYRGIYVKIILINYVLDGFEHVCFISFRQVRPISPINNLQIYIIKMNNFHNTSQIKPVMTRHWLWI